MNRQVIDRFSTVFTKPKKQSPKYESNVSPKFIKRRKSLNLASPIHDRKKVQRLSESLEQSADNKVYFTKIRKHDSLPLVHDGQYLYGKKPKKFVEYRVAQYPWKNTRSVKSEELKSKPWKRLGKLPHIQLNEIEEGSMSVYEDKNFTAFRLYMTDLQNKNTKPKNIKQLKKDVSDSGRNQYLKSHTFALLDKIFVEDVNWQFRYPIYSQGMDRTVNDWGIKGDVRKTVNDIRLMFLAMEFVCSDWKVDGQDIVLHSLEFLGRITPFENIPPSYSESVLPLYEFMKNIVHDMRFDSAYYIAKKTKLFYEEQCLQKNNTFKSMIKFLKECGYTDLIPMVTMQPELLVTYRGKK